MLAVAILVVLFVATEVVSDALVLAFDPSGAVARTGIKLVCFILAVFVLIPGLLRLPTGSSTIGSFPTDVGLVRIRHPRRDVLLLILVYATFAASQVVGQWVHYVTTGDPIVVDLARHELLGMRPLISGVFEEIVMRGVLVTYLLTRYSRSRTVYVSSGVFAGIHLLNLLNPAVDPVWVLAQVVWAFAIGILYAEIFIRTRSLYVPILVHFLVNATVGVWFQGLGARDFTSAMIGLPFYGVVPALIGLWWLRMLRVRA